VLTLNSSEGRRASLACGVSVGVAPLRLKESPLRQPGQVEPIQVSTPVGFAAHARAWCAFVGWVSSAARAERSESLYRRRFSSKASPSFRPQSRTRGTRLPKKL